MLPPTTQQLYAVSFACGASILDIVTRAIQRRNDRGWCIAFLGSWLGAVILWPGEKLRVDLLTPLSTTLFVLAGCVWTVMVYWDLKAYEHADASTNVLAGSLRTVLLVLAGAFFFGETITAQNLCGAALIFLGVITGTSTSLTVRRQGIVYRMGSMLAGTTAVLIEKKLVGLTNVSMVLFSGYLIPGIFYTFMRPRGWREQISWGEPSSSVLLIVAIALYIGLGPLLVTSFGQGSLSSTFLISQSRIGLVLILSALFLREREHLKAKVAGALLCAAGVPLVIAS